MQLQPGQTILSSKYRIERLLGRGAFGEVYLATHLQLNVARAVKVLLRDTPGVGSTEFGEYRGRFQLEAQVGARLDHQHIVRVYDFEEADGALYLVMAYCPGGSLKDRLDRARETRQLMPVEEAVRIATDVAHGLAAIHALEVVHRDLKPSNVLFDADGRAQVGDLGLAQVPGASTRGSLRSVPAPDHPGTPEYMSPEQETTKTRLRPPSDVYALGALLFEMLTGQLYNNVRPGTRAGSLRADVPKWLDDLIARMLAQKPEDRPWDGAEAVKSLEEGWQRIEADNRKAAETERVQREAEEDARQAHEKAEAAARAEAAKQAHQAAKIRRRILAGVAVLVLLLGGGWGLAQLLRPTPPRVVKSAVTQAVLTTETPTVTPTPLPPTPDRVATSTAEAAQTASQAAIATSTHAASVKDAANTVVADKAGTEIAVAAVATNTAATVTATAKAAVHAKETASARATETAQARDATSTANAQKTANVIAIATKDAQATAKAKATATKAATATPVRPGLIFDFERAYTWKPGHPYGTLTRSTEQAKNGSSSGLLQYNFPAVADEFIDLLPQPALTIPGQATGITALVYGNGSGHFLNAWVQDADGERRAYTFGKVQHQGWQQMTAWLDETYGWPNGHIDGPDDGRLRYPIKLNALVLDWVPEGQDRSGVIYVDDLFSTQDAIPKSQPTSQPGPTSSPPQLGNTPGPGQGAIPAIILGGPPTDYNFSGPDARIELGWSQSGHVLGSDEYYLVTIQYPHDSATWSDYQWSRTTQLAAPAYLYDLATGDRFYTWSVALVRLVEGKAEGDPAGRVNELARSEQPKRFLWTRTGSPSTGLSQRVSPPPPASAAALMLVVIGGIVYASFGSPSLALDEGRSKVKPRRRLFSRKQKRSCEKIAN